MESVYQQVTITCTTINLIIFVSLVVNHVIIKIKEHREKKRKDKATE